jgi:D-alanine-D-alanine ligase
MKAAGIPVAESLLMHRLDVAKAHPMEPPYVVKPVAEGSSFGVLIVREGATHPPQQLFAEDWRYGDTVMVERYIAGRELTCGVKGDEAFDIIELVTDDGGWYDYDAKYSDNGARHVIPAPLLPDIYQSIRNLSVRAHRALGCRGISRADFRYDDRPGGTGELVCLEVNTQPGMTATSLVPDMARFAGMDFPALVSWMVEDASCGR